MANGSFAGTFSVYTSDDATYAVESPAAFADLPPVFYREGETVTATAWDEAAKTLVADASDAGTMALGSAALDAGGVWTLANSGQGTAFVGVAWSVYGDGGMLAAGGPVSGYVVDTMQYGPDRKLWDRNAPPVAYSGDDWAGDVSKAATVTFTPPKGTATTLNLAGTGTTQFTFDLPGKWTVRLTMANGTTRTAVLSVSGGLTIVIR